MYNMVEYRMMNRDLILISSDERNRNAFIKINTKLIELKNVICYSQREVALDCEIKLLFA